MRKFNMLSFGYIAQAIVLLSGAGTGNCQSPFEGTWEGAFLNDFRIEVQLYAAGDTVYKGTVKMFSGENIMQHDTLSELLLRRDSCTFYIPDKKTHFFGQFNSKYTVLSGEFVFPDQTVHPLVVRKLLGGSQNYASQQHGLTKTFTAEQLKEDLAFLHEELLEKHPRLYAYTSEDTLNLLLKTLNNRVDDSLTLVEFYFLASQLTNVVKCSHTGLKLPFMCLDSIDKEAGFFPFNMFFAEGIAYFLSYCCDTSGQIQPGCEIISMNDFEVDQLLHTVFACIPSEGHNGTTKYNRMNRDYASFLYMVCGTEPYRISFWSNGYKKQLTVPSCKSPCAARSKGLREDSPMDFKFLENTTLAFLKIPSFGIRDMDLYFNSLDTLFKSLKTENTKNLVLDLRDNAGGHPIFAAQLLSYLTKNEFTYFERNSMVPDFEPLYNPMQPNQNAFTGDIYVLVNGGCLSTTGHLISLLFFHTDAVFVGEEPGSTSVCNDLSIQAKLPNTQIVLNVPRTTFITAVQNEPFELDFEVKQTPEDKVSNKDVYLDEVLDLIWINKR